MNKRILSLIACLFLLSACQKRVKAEKLHSLKLGMSKEQVIANLGEPTMYRGSMKNNYDQVVDLYEYMVDPGFTSDDMALFVLGCIYTVGLLAPFYPLMHGTLQAYWMYFYNNNLVQWCKAGDWDTAQHSIQEIRFR